MLKKCTPWWREAHCEVKSVKNGRLGALFEVSLSYRFPIFETSATALCGTTGKVGFLTLCLLLKSAMCRPMSGDFVEDGVGLRRITVEKHRRRLARRLRWAGAVLTTSL